MRNVILIVLDTLWADHPSSYGYCRQTSPNLDAFGAVHARFVEARSQAGCTHPSASRYRPEFHTMSSALAQRLGHVEGSASGDRTGSEEARKVLEAVGYLK